ncbi:MAG: choice-of-anchor E domain-containing protein [Candidatus Eisenbacteria bacterium]|nr:choice-of-anchor E domain-containing protein [Candidatus Eisenbacteria bacterium]
MSSLRRVVLYFLVLGSCVALSAAVGEAYTVSHCASVPLGATNWNTTMSFPKFTGECECLQSICFQLCGHVEGTAKFESMDAAPTTVTMNLQSTITLMRPDMSTLVVVIPLANTSDNVTEFDGVIDFGGTSGKTYSGLTGDATDSECTVAPADFALFCGTGNIDLPITAIGTSNGSGAGNLILQFATSASANATVTYTYDCGTPVNELTWGRIKATF